MKSNVGVRELLLAALLVGLAAVLLPASANARKNVHDPRGDVALSGHLPDADYDIVDAKVSRHGKRIKVTVKVAGRAVVGGDHTAFGSGVQVEIDTKLRGRTQCNGNARDAYGRAEYILSTVDGPVLIDCIGRRIPVGKHVGFKDRRHKLIFTFNRHKIGNPYAFRWYASTGEDRPFDLAPDLNGADGPRYTRFRLGAGHHKGHRGRSRLRHCATHSRGAGIYRLRAKRAGCKTAKKVSKHWVSKGWMRPDRKWHGWRCHDRLVGAEDFKASCKKHKHGRRKKIKFEYGS